MQAVEPKDWKWYGSASHLIVGNDCRFHLATKVGPWLVSTVGEYLPGGCGRKYETMVFRLGRSPGECPCGCGLPKPVDWGELDVAGYNDAKAATAGHYAMCEKWAALPDMREEARLELARREREESDASD